MESENNMSTNINILPLVSILLPVYNSEKYLEACLNSIVTQSYKNMEIIIINDGSTDSCNEIIKIYQQKYSNIKYSSRMNKGLIATLNEGLQKCTGKYIARMDNDDIADEHRIEFQVNILESNPEIFLCGTNIEKIDAFGKTISKNISLPKEMEELKAFSLFRSPFIHSTVMFRNNDTISYNAEFNDAEDYELWSRLIINEKKND